MEQLQIYISGQMPILHQIIALQQMGMTLEEIKMIRQGLPVEEFMVRKKSELLRCIAEDTSPDL